MVFGIAVVMRYASSLQLLSNSLWEGSGMKRWQVALAFAALAGVLVAVPAMGDSQGSIGETVKALVKKQRQDRQRIKRLEKLVAKLPAPGYRAPIGPPGAVGPTGPTGATGPAGGSAVVVRTEEAPIVLGEGGEGSLQVDCEAGETVMGGGASSSEPDMNYSVSAPTTGGGGELAGEGDSPTGWRVAFKNNSALADFSEVVAYALCASP